jgi:PAS domain S-box-containing protein
MQSREPRDADLPPRLDRVLRQHAQEPACRASRRALVRHFVAPQPASRGLFREGLTSATRRQTRAPVTHWRRRAAIYSSTSGVEAFPTATTAGEGAPGALCVFVRTDYNGGHMVRARRPTKAAPVAQPPPAPRHDPPFGVIDLDAGELFENASDIMLINDRDGRIVMANRAARDFAGYSLEDAARGVYLRDVLTAADSEVAMLLTQRALDGLPFPEVYEREAVLRDGSQRVLELRSNVLQLPDSRRLLQTVGRDITDKKEAAAFQAGLLQASQALLNAQSAEQLWHTICEEASRFLQVESVYLWLPQGDELVGCAAVGRAAAEFQGRRYALHDALLEAFGQTPGVAILNDFQHSPLADEAGLAAGVQSVLVVPLRRATRVVGLLVFADYDNANHFTAAMGDRAMIFGAQITVAIESALARQGEEEEGRVSAALLHVARVIRESLEEKEVLPQIAHSAREVLECDWTLVALWDTTKEAFRITTIEGWSGDAAEELKSLDLGRGTLPLIEQLLAHETVEIQEPRGRVGLWERWGVGSLLGVPMLRAGRVVGVLVVGHRERRGPFPARQRRIAEGVAAQAAVAVENARLVEALRRANRLKSEFLGMMSHELRTPMNAILGYAGLMRDGAMGPIGAEQVEALDRMLLNGRALLDLINMTLDVNRLEAGRIPLECSAFTISELLDELRHEFAMAAAEGVAVSWPEVADLPPLHTDRSKLKLVVRNLIDNALKFTARGSVVITVSAHSDRLQLSVRDTGVGIPPESLSSVFEMFQQLNGAASSARGGVGLGLYLVRRYAELLGGAVTVESVPGVGSTFTVDVPRILPGGG